MIRGMRWIRRAVLLLLAPVLVVAAGATPLELVRDTSERMLGELRANHDHLRENPGEIYDLVDEIVLPNFDFETMSRWVLGRYWRDADAVQRDRFVEEFRTLLVRTYATALLEYSNEQIRFPTQPDPAADVLEVTVRTEIVPRSGGPIPVNYSMHRRDDRWLVFDVVIDGVSIVTNYRNTIAEQVRSQGLDAMIAGLAERNATSRSGS